MYDAVNLRDREIFEATSEILAREDGAFALAGCRFHFRIVGLERE